MYGPSQVCAGVLLLGALVGVPACETKDASEELGRFYSRIDKTHFHQPGVVLAIPFDLEQVGDKLRDMLPARYRGGRELAESHVRFLDGGSKGHERARLLARIALASSRGAMRTVLKKRSWRALGLAGQRQVASVLAAGRGVTPADLRAASPDLSDPVVLYALMVRTGHTYGAPPRFLLKKGDKVSPAVSAHWLSWLKREWLAFAKKTRHQRGALERAEIRKLWASPKTRERAWQRYAACRTHSFATLAEMLKYSPKERERSWRDNARDDLWNYLWLITMPEYGP